MSLSAWPMLEISVDAQRKTMFSRPSRMVAFHGVRYFSLTAPNHDGMTRSLPIANEIRAEDTMAAWSEASVPPRTATIITFFQNPPPILSPTKARMFPALACMSPLGAMPWKARTATE